ncbi:MAG: hypothetical protein ACK5LR_03275 [Mangrovibacterium sp.]
MKKCFLWAILLVGITVVSCENTSVDKGSEDKIGSEIDNNPDQSGITEIDSIAVATPVGDLASASMRVKSGENGSSGTIIPMKIVANVASPTVQGATVQATCVAYDATTMVAYVSYNTQDLDAANVTYKGAIQAISLQDPKQPEVLTMVKTNGYEFSSVAIDAENDYLFAVGAADVDKMTINGLSLSYPAVLLRYKLNADGSVKNEVPTCQPLTSYVAKDVKVENGLVFVVSGDAGGAFVYDTQTLERKGYLKLDDLRSFAVIGTDAYVLSGAAEDRQGYIHKFENGSGEFRELISGVNMDNADFAGAQRIMDAYGDYLLVPQGEYGLSVYPQAGGASVNDIPIYSTTDASKIVVINTVRSVRYKGYDYLLLAEGEAGLCVRSITDNDITQATTDRGVVDLNGSANYAYVGANATGGDFIFVATGVDGVNVLQLLGGDNGGGDGNPSLCETEYPDAVFEDYDTWTGDKNIIQNGSSGQVYYFYSASGNMNFDKNIAVTLVWNGDFCLSTTVQNNGVLVVCDGNLYCNWVNLNNGEVLLDGNVEGYGGINFNSGAKMTVQGNDRTMTIKDGLTLNGGSNLYVEGDNMHIVVNSLTVQGGNLIVNGNNCDIDIAGQFGSNGGSITFNGTGNTIDAGSEGNGNTKIYGDWSTETLKKTYE